MKIVKSEDTLLSPFIGSIVHTLYLYLNVYKTLLLDFHDWQRTLWNSKYTREPVIILICYLGLRLPKLLRNLNDQVSQKALKKLSQLKYLIF